MFNVPGTSVTVPINNVKLRYGVLSYRTRWFFTQARELTIVHINRIQCLICWIRLVCSFIMNCVRRFYAFMNLYYKIEIKKQLYSWIFRGAGSDDNLNGNWLYIYISFPIFLLMQMAERNYIFKCFISNKCVVSLF